MTESIDLIFLLLMAAIVIALVCGAISWRSRRRRRLLGMPLPEEWHKILHHNVALTRILPEPLRRELHGRINVFLDEKEFEGCGGLIITDEVRVTIAALACILLLNKEGDDYPSLRSILVYPGAFVVPGGKPVNSVVYDDEEGVHLGESWLHGSVILAWDQVIHDGRRPRSGNNVVLHEFAHQLDQQKGFSDGVPELSDPAEAERFARVIARDFVQLREESESGIHDVIDEYGTVNPAEFFAVSTEAFFTMPSALRRSHRDLYDCLSCFYRLDPVSWRNGKDETDAGV